MSTPTMQYCRDAAATPSVVHIVTYDRQTDRLGTLLHSLGWEAARFRRVYFVWQKWQYILVKSVFIAYAGAWSQCSHKTHDYYQGRFSLQQFKGPRPNKIHRLWRQISFELYGAMRSIFYSMMTSSSKTCCISQIQIQSFPDQFHVVYLHKLAN